MSFTRSTNLGYEFPVGSPYFEIDDMPKKAAVDKDFMVKMDELFPRVVRMHWMFGVIDKEYQKRQAIIDLMKERLRVLGTLTGFAFALTEPGFVCRYIIIDGEHRLVYTAPFAWTDKSGMNVVLRSSILDPTGKPYEATPVINESWEHEIPEDVCRTKDGLAYYLHLKRAEDAKKFGIHAGTSSPGESEGVVTPPEGTPHGSPML